MCQTLCPCVDGFFDQRISVYKSRFALMEGIADFTIVLPFTEQQHLASRFGGHAEHTTDMPLLHHQNQVRLTDGLWRQLKGLMLMGKMTMLHQDGAGRRFYGLAYQRGKACRIDLDIGMDECLAQQMLRGRAATNIADTDNQNPFKQDNLPVLSTLAVTQHLPNIRVSYSG